MNKTIVRFSLFSMLMLASAGVVAAQQKGDGTVTLEGQVVCSSCWVEADCTVKPYGTEGDSELPSVTLTENGYEPASFQLRRDVPARVTFLRKVGNTCGTEIVIKAFDIKRKLPFNEPVIVEFTPRKKGEFALACGMGML